MEGKQMKKKSCNKCGLKLIKQNSKLYVCPKFKRWIFDITNGHTELVGMTEREARIFFNSPY